MVDIETARQQVSQARQQLEAQRQKAQETREQLNQSKASLPDIRSQEALRLKMVGLRGLQARKNVLRAEKEIEGKQILIQGYEQDLSKFETEQLKPAEAQIQAYDAEVADYNARVQAMSTAQKFYDKRVPYTYTEGYVREYLKQMYEQGALNQQAFINETQNIQASLPDGERLLIDYKNMRIKGVDTGSQTLSVSEYNKRITQLNANIQKAPEIQNILLDQSKLNLNQKDLTAVSKLKNINFGGSMFPMVSAATGNAVRDTTTGVLNKVKNLFLNTKAPPTEVYSSTLGGFVQANEQGRFDYSGTAIVRPPTYEESIKINKAQEAGSYKKTIGRVLTPTLNFLSGNLEWQKKLTSKFEERARNRPEWQQPYWVKLNMTSRDAELERVNVPYFQVADPLAEKAVKGTSNLYNLNLSASTQKKIARVGVDVGTFALFSPAMKTGSYAQQESEYVYDAVQQKFIKKKDLLAYLQKPEISGKTYKIGSELSYQTKADRLNFLLKNLKDKNDPNAIKNILNLGRETYGESFIKDFMTQEGLMVSSAVLSAPSVATKTEQAFQVFSEVPKMKQIGKVQGSYSMFQSVSAKPDTQTKQTQATRNNLGIKTDTQTKQNMKVITMLNLKTNQRTDTIQKPNQDTQTKVTQKNDNALKYLSAFKQTSPQVTKTRTQQNVKQNFGRPQPRPEPKPKKPVYFPKSPLIKRLSEKVKEQPETFSVIGRRFGTDVTLLKTTSKEKAEKGLLTFLKTSLGRSGKITKGGEALGFNELALFKNKEFRPSKRDETRIVQEAKYSLGSAAEKQEIQYFARKKKKKSFSWL